MAGTGQPHTSCAFISEKLNPFLNLMATLLTYKRYMFVYLDSLSKLITSCFCYIRRLKVIHQEKYLGHL